MKAVDWLFRDRRTGRFVVAQWPNIALAVWLVASMARSALGLEGGWGTATRVVATAALTWWALDEIVRGVNPWRRGLGAVVLLGLVVSVIGR